MNNILPTSKIIGESFFGKLPKDPVLLETDFVRMDKSVIWKLSELFWKYYSLWEKTYKENFEASLPSGISESHRPEFIKASADRFIHLTEKLQKENLLPEKVYVYEQGPGSGIFAKGFLDEIKQQTPKIYVKTIYILSDSSQEILQTCQDVLDVHKNHTKFYMQDAFEHEKKYDGKILFARHSNVWDGWPCRFIQMRKSGLGEVYVRAVVSHRFQDFIHDIHAKDMEYAVLHNTKIWKDFFRNVKLQTRTIPFSAIDVDQHFYLQNLQTNIVSNIGRNTLLSDYIIDNLTFLHRLIDWERHGYIEIVDIITPQPRKSFPKKYDGSIGYIIDGGLVETWCRKMDKGYSFKSIRKLNTMITITNNQKKSLREMVQEASLEVYPSKDLLEHIDVIDKNTTLAITCTSKLGIDHTLDTTIAINKKGYNAYPHFPARLVKDEKEVREKAQKLLDSNITDMFVAAGNPDFAIGNYESAIQLLHALKKINFPFSKVAIAAYPEGHPRISQEKLMEALEEKQKFAQENTIDMKIITQFCFTADVIIQWALDIKKKGISLPIAIGIPGPYDTTKLLEFAIKCGVGDSLKFLRDKKRFPLQYNPERLLQEIYNHPQLNQTNITGFHFYTFNNLSEFAKWKEKFLTSLSVAKD